MKKIEAGEDQISKGKEVQGSTASKSWSTILKPQLLVI